MAGNLIIGIDVGTTSVKAGLFNSSGAQLETYHASYETIRSAGGYVEQDPDMWVFHIRQALADFAVTRDLSDLCSIGITSQVNTHVFVNAEGKALAPAIVWQDTRCADVAVQLDAKISPQDKNLWWGAPMPVDASHCLARMEWMRQNQTEIWQKTRYVMLPKDYCIFKLTGEVVSDAISNIGMVDLGQKYIHKLLELVPGAAQRTIPLAKMSDIAGTISGEEPCAGTPVAVGTMDAWAGMFGVGVQSEGEGFYLSGTSEIMGIISQQNVPTPGILVFPEVEQMRLHAGPTQSGGASINWFCDLFGITFQSMADIVASLDPDASVPIFLPHIAGERAPIWDSRARGVFLGVDSQTGKAEMAKAVYEGVSFSARWLAETLGQSAACEVKQFNCGGGGFRSDVFNQIRANILGVRLKKISATDPGVLGAVALASVAGGMFDNLGDALGEIVNYDKTFDPDMRQHEHYCKKFELYKDTYQTTSDINHRLLKL